MSDNSPTNNSQNIPSTVCTPPANFHKTQHGDDQTKTLRSTSNCRSSTEKLLELQETHEISSTGITSPQRSHHKDGEPPPTRSTVPQLLGVSLSPHDVISSSTDAEPANPTGDDRLSPDTNTPTSLQTSPLSSKEAGLTYTQMCAADSKLRSSKLSRQFEKCPQGPITDRNIIDETANADSTTVPVNIHHTPTHNKTPSSYNSNYNKPVVDSSLNSEQKPNNPNVSPFHHYPQSDDNLSNSRSQARLQNMSNTNQYPAEPSDLGRSLPNYNTTRGPGNSKSSVRTECTSSKPLHPMLVNASASLELKSLWDDFNELGTEMIVTKAGR